MPLINYNMLSTKSSENTPKNISKKFSNEDEENFFFWAVFRDLNKYAPARFGTPRLNEPLYNDLNGLCRFIYEGIIKDEQMNEIVKKLKTHLLQNINNDFYNDFYFYYNDYFIKFVQYDECSRKQFKEEGKPEFCELFDEYVNDYIEKEEYVNDYTENDGDMYEYVENRKFYGDLYECMK